MPILTASERVGTEVGGRYRVGPLVAEGGFSAVFAGAHLVTERPVALKLVHAHLVQTPQIGQRFLQEAQAMARIRHPGIVEVLDAGQEPDGTVWLALELLEGETLEQELKRAVRMSVTDAVRYTCDVLEALDMVHTHGIVHRDIKPSNVYLAEGHDGVRRAKLLDFGIAHVATRSGGRLTQTGMILGTPEYMAPEQGRSQSNQLGPQADLWSVGIVLFELLSGDVPWTGDGASQTIVRAASDPVPDLTRDRPDVPAQIVAVILRALEKEPAARFANAREMRVALAHAMRDAGLDPHRRFEPGPRAMRRPESSTSLPAMRAVAPAAAAIGRDAGSAATPVESAASALRPPSIHPVAIHAPSLRGNAPRVEFELDLGPATGAHEADDTLERAMPGGSPPIDAPLPELDGPPVRSARVSIAPPASTAQGSSGAGVATQVGHADDGEGPTPTLDAGPTETRPPFKPSASPMRLPAAGLAIRNSQTELPAAGNAPPAARPAPATPLAASAARARRDVGELAQTGARSWKILALTGVAIAAGLVGIVGLREHARREAEARRRDAEAPQGAGEGHVVAPPTAGPPPVVHGLVARYAIPVPVGLDPDDARSFARHVALSAAARNGGVRMIATCARGTVYLYGNGDGLPVASRAAPIACDHKDLTVVPDLDGDGQDDVAAVNAARDGIVVLDTRELRAERTVPVPHAVGLVGGLTVHGAPAVVAYAEPDGAAGATQLVAIDVRSGAVLWRVTGEAPLSRLGHPTELGLVVGPDATGDGVPDVLAGTTVPAGLPPDATPARPRCVELFSGATGERVWHQPFCQLRGGSQSVSLGPDIDGDGAGDVAIGTDVVRGADPHVVLLSGRTAAPLRRIATPDGPSAAGFGWPVSLGQDVNGDGHPDVVVGSVGSAGTFVTVLSAASGLPFAAAHVPGAPGFPALGVAIADGLIRGGGAALLVAGPEDGMHVMTLSDAPASL